MASCAPGTPNLALFEHERLAITEPARALARGGADETLGSSTERRGAPGGPTRGLVAEEKGEQESRTSGHPRCSFVAGARAMSLDERFQFRAHGKLLDASVLNGA